MMQEYTYEEINENLTHSFTVQITEKHQNMFRNLSGDINPLHIEADFAKEKGFKSKVVYGMLTSSFYSTLAGVYLPGKNCLLHEVHIKFSKPVFIGDILNVQGTVISKNDIFKQLEIKATIKNQENIVISKAIIKAGVLNEE